MADHFGRQTASGHLTVAAESKAPYADDVLASLYADAELIMGRYPQKRSALLPLLHLVQSVDGYVTGRGIDLCADLLDLSTAEVSGVATFYTQYKRHPNGEYTVGVCINTLCAVMGGDRIWEEVSDHLGIGHDETTPDGKITLERIECNAACDFAPVVMANWEFFDNQTPNSTKALVDDLRAGADVRPTRGPDRVCTFKEVSRTLAGFGDGLADQGVGAGPPSLVGLEVARAHGWVAPGTEPATADPQHAGPGTPSKKDGASEVAAADEVVPHDVSSAPPTAADEQAPHEAADGDKPIEASQKPEAHTPHTDEKQDEEPVPVEGTPAIVADIDTGHVDQPATEQAGVAGTPAPPAPEPAAPEPKPAAHAPEPVAPEPEPAAQAPEPAVRTESDVDDATVARIKLVSRGAAGLTAYEDDDEAGTTVSRRDLLAGLAASEKAADRGSYDDAGHGEGSAKPAADGSGPAGWDVKGNATAKVFHTPESPWYKRTRPEVWFRDAAAAALAGFADALERHRDHHDESDGKDEA